ncbi:MAG: lamin tail domain-containing protein [Deltaproteobacteria bacterium]|nr:lamin tail domain-containing protein [Deltaproteobacteria bacterium]
MAKITKHLAACAVIAALAGGCGESTGPKYTPAILQFAAFPIDAYEGDYRLLSWQTTYADRITIMERIGAEGDYSYDVLFESDITPNGALEYRVHSALTLVLRAYNTGSRREAEQYVDITTDVPDRDHLVAFYPESPWLGPGECAQFHYTIANVQAGMSLHMGIVEPALIHDDRTWLERGGVEMIHNFDTDGDTLHGTFEVTDCASSTSFLKISHHTGFYAQLHEAAGDLSDYAENYVGFFEVPLPEITSFTADDYTIILGGATTVRWEVREADSVELSGYSAQYCDAWRECVGTAEATPTGTMEYTLTATGPGGIMLDRLTIEVTTTPTAPIIESFTAAPTEIRPGTATTLTWDTTLADSVAIVGVPADSSLPSTFTTDGTADVTPTATTVYTLTATNTVGSTPGTVTVTVTPLMAGDLVVSEIMMNPATVSDTTGEWFEIYNPGSMTVNLNGLTIGTGSATDTIDSDVLVAGSNYALLALSSTPGENDNLPTPDFVYAGLAFDETSADTLSVIDGGTTIDAVAWDGSSWTVTEGDSWSLDPSTLTATDNDTFTNWCDGSAMWTGAASNYGSPGAANPTCS